MRTDQEIIESVLNGNKDSFRLLIQKYEDKLFGLCIRMLQNKERAEDVLQESLIEIYRNLGAYKFRSSFSTWAYTITYRRIAKEFKEGKRNLLLDEFDALVQNNNAVTQEEELDYDTTELLQKALKTLSPLEHSLLSLYYFDGLSISEMSEVVQYSEGKIKTVLHRTRGKLKQKINLLRKEAEHV